MDHSIDLLLWLAYNDNQSLLCLPDRGWSQFHCSVETNAISSFSGESGTDSVWRFPRLCVRCAFNLQFYFYNQKRDFRMSRTFLARPESSEWCQEQMCGNAAVLSLVFLLLICSVVVAQCSTCSLSWGQSVPVVRELPTFLPRRTLNCALGRCCSNNSISRWSEVSPYVLFDAANEMNWGNRATEWVRTRKGTNKGRSRDNYSSEKCIYRGKEDINRIINRRNRLLTAKPINFIGVQLTDWNPLIGTWWWEQWQQRGGTNVVLLGWFVVREVDPYVRR